MRGMRLDWRLAVRLLGALALVMVAFAHRLPLPAANALPDVASYAFPDGSIPVICVTSPTGDDTPGIRHALPCDACMVASSVLLPQPPALNVPAFDSAAQRFPSFAAFVLPRAVWHPSAPPTAPPAA